MLSAKQQKAAILLADGTMTQKQIAEELKVTEQTIVNWKKRKDFQEEQRKIAERFLANELGGLVKNQLDLALNAKSEMVRFSATKDLLDRADFVPNTEDKGESDAQLASEKYDELIRETAKARLDIQASAGDE